jgi:competence protein ComEC
VSGPIRDETGDLVPAPAAAGLGWVAAWLARPLVPLAGAFAAGIVLQLQLRLPAGPWTGAAGLALALGLAGWWLGWRRLALPSLVVAFAALGGQAMATSQFAVPANHLSRLPEGHLEAPVRLEGWVVLPPDPRPAETRDLPDADRIRFVVEMLRLRLGETWVAVRGRARLTVLGAPAAVHYGDEVRGAFRLRRPGGFFTPGAFDYPAYLATQGIFLEGWSREPVEVTPGTRGSPWLAGIFRLRGLLLARLDAALPPRQAGLLKALVLGDRSGLTPEMNQAFLASGTYHILAISGLNVSLLAGALFGLLRLLRVSPRVAALLAAALVTGYAALAGAGASVVRAAVMADTFLLAVVLDRRADLLNSLALSALLLLWWNPRYLADVGFQLTFLATLGIVLVVPRCDRALGALPRWLRWPLASVAMTLAASLMTLPVLAQAFNRVAPAGVLANLPIVPLSGLITGCGTAASAALALRPEGIPALNQGCGWLAETMLATANRFAGLPWSSVTVYTPTPGMLAAYYGAVACGLVVLLGRRIRWRLALAGAGCLCLLALGGQVAMRLAAPDDAGRLRLTMLDVGQGEAILLELPGRHRILVDAARMGPGGFDLGARVVGPFLLHEWIGSLDVLVLTHPDADHIGGAVSLLRTFPVAEVWSGDTPETSIDWLWVQEALRRWRIPHRIVSHATPRVRWGEAEVEVLHPPPRGPTPAEAPAGGPGRSNEASIVLEITIGGQRALLTGDLGPLGEAALLQEGRPVRAQVLKVAHHGSRVSSGPTFLDAVRPEVALVSAGRHNRFHHPHPEVVARLQERGVRLLRTDLEGTITVEMTPQGLRAWGSRDQGSGVRDQGSGVGSRGQEAGDAGGAGVGDQGAGVGEEGER